MGYVRGNQNSHSYKKQMKFLDSLNVERIFHEKNAGNTELNAMIDYARSGDIIFIYSIEIMGKNVKQTIRFITQTQEKNIELFIKKEKLDTSNLNCTLSSRQIKK
ncbi:recombinase family protein [Clostridium sp. M14]|uniref:recombinase family protein n=1 Tax=Clostridium sp. M14 TaxID=2716311 RepID=UPI001CCE1E9E|nr:recombinase family protein [Clostridium sp. M14]MBZ9690670.1 recombinase family protein [Clostridium sp. M14]